MPREFPTPSSPSSLGEGHYEKHELRDPWETTDLPTRLCNPPRNGVGCFSHLLLSSPSFFLCPWPSNQASSFLSPSSRLFTPRLLATFSSFSLTFLMSSLYFPLCLITPSSTLLLQHTPLRMMGFGSGRDPNNTIWWSTPIQIQILISNSPCGLAPLKLSFFIYERV